MQVHFLYCGLPNISGKRVLVYAESQRWTPREPGHLKVGAEGGLGEHAHVRDIESSGDMNKIFDDVLGTNFDVGGRERFHHFPEVPT